MKRSEIIMGSAAITGVAVAIFGPVVVGSNPLNPFQVFASVAISLFIGWVLGSVCNTESK